ncbi:MAG: CBS domain-containing protein [Solirubrobacteraceae bacterium]
MARTPLEQTERLTAAEVIHPRFTALPASATVGDVRDWFAQSDHRRMAFLADGDRYAGSIERDALFGAGIDLTAPASALASPGPIVAPDDSARASFELATETEANRVPVVDGDGRLLGVVGVTEDRRAFCGGPQGPRPDRAAPPAAAT